WLTKLASAARPKWRCSASATRYWRSRRFIARMAPGRGSRGPRHVLRRGRVADQEVERAQRRGTAGTHRDHDLLVRHRGRVAGGEHARHAGGAALVDHDLAARA